MYNFDFYNPTRIFFGKDRLDNIDKFVPANAKVLITYGGGSAKKADSSTRLKPTSATERFMNSVVLNPIHTTKLR